MEINTSNQQMKDNDLYRMIVFRLIAIFIISSTALFLLFMESPSLFNPHRLLLRKVLGMGHIPLFGLLGWIVLLGINLKNPKVYEWPIWSYGAAFLFTVGLSFFTELVQIITPRDASIKDFLFNNLGSGIFLSAGIVWANKSFKHLAGKWHKNFKIGFILLTIFILASVLRPLVPLVLDERNIRKSFPVIGSFETTRELRRWRKNNSKLSLSQQYVTHGKYSLCATLYPGKFSGITMPHPPGDWRGFHSLEFSIFNPANKNLKLIIKIFDSVHNFNYNDRFNKTIIISPGKNVISLPLSIIESAPVKRKMKMDKIAQISFFMKDLNKKQILYFDDIQLLKEISAYNN